jgi:acetyl-CoA acetyltransferase
MATAAGGDVRWSGGTGTTLAPGDLYPSAGAEHSARRLYAQAGVGPGDVDVALLYDHFGPMVLMQLEDYGFCSRGESGPFVADGNIRVGGTIPVNTHGGHLSEAYIIGMTHVVEAVEQVRGTAINQVEGCEIALATGGPSSIPTSSILLRR